MENSDKAGWLVLVFAIGCFACVWFYFWVPAAICFVMSFVMIYFVNKFNKEEREQEITNGIEREQKMEFKEDEM